ncbi:MAG: glycoside hydrolase family protein, partial [Bacteroidales bacterium]|nr:glycoside hydrolase family protein [Bacteroidales bacterium]
IATTSGNITYLYAADGVKQRVVHGTAVTDYCGNFVYENGTLDKILTEEGYITMNGTIPTYHYYLQDHEGNNHVVINQSGTVEQVNHYYPFGTLFAESTNDAVQKYKYNGKELDRQYSLNLYDYGARYYDSVLGQWTAQDPMAEKYYDWSSYVYSSNNPRRYVDSNGRDWYQFENKNGEKSTIWQEGDAKTITINDQIYNNIGATYLAKYDGGAIFYNQNNITDVYPYMAASNLSISDKGLSFLIDREGLKLKPYNDSRNFSTIGIGHLIKKRKVTEQDKKSWAWFDTRQEAMDLLRTDLSCAYEKAVKSLVNVPLMQFQYDAIVSFTFNIGVGGLEKSNFLKELNGGNYNGQLMLNYHRPSDIIPRRKKEVNLFNNATY